MDEHHPRFHIVGIGASAGGIEALSGFFAGVAADCGMAFVIVTHLSPDRPSLLAEVVERMTPLPVSIAQDGLRIAPNNVYVLAEATILTIGDGRLQVAPLDRQQRERRPIDLFFAALAQDQGEYAVGIVLSGGDGDGTTGIRAIKERGGLTFAQTAEGTRPSHPDMPESAIATGLVDFAVPVERMGPELVAFATSVDDRDRASDQDEKEDSQAFVDLHRQIYDILRNQIGHDFSGYKPRTFYRRVRRRMQMLQVHTLEAYVERLRMAPTETTALFRDLLINVTGFFRDPDPFEALAGLVIPKLFEGRGADDVIRIWIAGCATGEEVYSIAILIREHMDTLKAAPKIQIFATDIDERSLAIARSARYPLHLTEPVSEERLARFFAIDGAYASVNKEIRELCIFSPHNVLRDPPFSRLDLVSCRNLLIYLGAEAQAQVIPVFHYALNPGGFLFLGTSESISQFSDLFAPLDKQHRLFRARDDGSAPSRIPVFAPHLRTVGITDPQMDRKSPNPTSFRQTIDLHVLERFAPAHVVVNADGDIVYYSNRTGNYLEASAGAPTRHLMTLARKGLRLELRETLRVAVESRALVRKDNICVDADDDRVRLVSLIIEPMPLRGEDVEQLYIILFVDTGPSLSREQALVRTHGNQDDAIVLLERELRELRERLQSMIEEYETALEELKSANEELVSVNEELQSTNEELEASKEELQSLNEELHAVNAELTGKVDSLDRSNNDLYNLFESTQIATVFLSADLKIRNFTPPLSRLFNIIQTDRGRPLSDLTSRLVYPGLLDDLRTTLASEAPLERRVSLPAENAFFLARLRPYRTSDGGIEGVIATFFDVTELAKSEASQRILIDELNHRGKAMLVAAADAARRAATNAPPGAQDQALLARLDAMALSYDAIIDRDDDAVALAVIVERSLSKFCPDRASFAGPPVALDRRSCLAFTMALHELLANAQRHGALSGPNGTVTVEWSETSVERSPDTATQFRWREDGGPAPTIPVTPGSGLALVEREIGKGLHGTATFDWRESGLVATFAFQRS